MPIITLDELAIKHGADKSSQYHNYCGIYEKYCKPIRGSHIQLLEIGVQYGRSARMWLEYFPNGTIYGMDIISESGINHSRFIFWHISQTDGAAIDEKLQDPAITFDIVVDDGSHLAKDQSIAFSHIWHKVRSGGVYIIEDTFTWSDDDFKSDVDGYAWVGTMVAAINHNGKAFYGKPHPLPDATLTYLESTIDFIHCHRGVLAIGKK